MPITLRGRHVRHIVALVALAASATAATAAEEFHHHHRTPQRPYPLNYHHNSLGYGRFLPGPDGSFGGYPAGSAGADELRNQQRYKCQAVPEEC